MRCTSRRKICYHGRLVRLRMPQYVIEREIPGAGNLTDAELQAVARKSVGVLKDMGPEIKWLHSYVTGDKVYCVYLAPDEETDSRTRAPRRFSGESHLGGAAHDRSRHRKLT